SRRYLLLSCHASEAHLHLHSFPTRRSSDLKSGIAKAAGTAAAIGAPGIGGAIGTLGSRAAMKAAAGSGAKIIGGKALRTGTGSGDRKSTRLNSSHVSISYAVFCFEKKNLVH